MDGEKVPPLPPLPAAILHRIDNLQPHWERITGKWRTQVVDLVQKDSVPPQPEDANAMQTLEEKLAAIRKKREFARAEQMRLQTRIADLHDKKSKVLELITDKEQLGDEVGGDKARKVLLNARVQRIEVAETELERVEELVNSLQEQVGNVKADVAALKERHDKAKLEWKREREQTVRHANVEALHIANNWFETAKKCAADLKQEDKLAPQRIGEAGTTVLTLRNIRASMIMCLDELETCCKVDPGKDGSPKEAIKPRIRRLQTHFLTSEEHQFMAEGIDAESASPDGDGSVSSFVRWRDQNTVSDEKGASRLLPSVDCDAFSPENPSSPLLQRPSVGAIPRALGTVATMATLRTDRTSTEIRTTSKKLWNTARLSVLTMNRFQLSARGGSSCGFISKGDALPSAELVELLESRDDKLLRKLLKRPQCSVEHWKGEKTSFGAFWRGCHVEESFEKVTLQTGFKLDPEQHALLAYEHALLLSTKKPQFTELISYVRLAFGISMSVHQSISSFLVPDGEVVGMDALDIRYRCAALLEPNALTDAAFVLRQLWVLEQSIISKDEVYVKPAMCLINELMSRSLVAEGPKSLLGPKAQLGDPLCPGDAVWEDLLRGTSSIYLAASLLRILNHMATNNYNTKPWLVDHNMDMVFCGPLWSVIVDSSYDDFWNPDCEQYVEIIASHFNFSTATFAILAASRYWYHLVKAIEDGDVFILHDSALATLARIVTEFESVFPSVATAALGTPSSKAQREPPPTPRDFLVRRIITAAFRDKLVSVLKDYRKYVMNGLGDVITVFLRAFDFVHDSAYPEPPRRRGSLFDLHENGVEPPPSPGISTLDSNTRYVRTLLRWCAFNAGQQQAARLIPTFMLEDNASILQEQEGIQKYMLGVADCVKNMRLEIPVEEDLFAPAWERIAQFDPAEHLAILVNAMRAEIMKHLEYIASPDGPWTEEDEIAPGVGNVVSEVVLFEEVATPLRQKGGATLTATIRTSTGQVAQVPDSLVSLIDRKVDDAMRVRWQILDDEIIRAALGSQSAWEPVRPTENILHSQGVLDLWHFVFEALDVVEVGFHIPAPLYGRTFVNFLVKLTNLFVTKATHNMQHTNEKNEKLFPLAEKGFIVHKFMPLLDEDDVVGGAKSDGEQVKKNEKYALFRKMDRGPLHLLQGQKIKNTPPVNECIVRLRSLAFFLHQFDVLEERFFKTSLKKSAMTNGDDGSTAAPLGALAEAWGALVADTKFQFAKAAKQIGRFFATKMVYEECLYLFTRVYSRKQDDAMSMSDVLVKEKNGICGLIQLMEVPGKGMPQHAEDGERAGNVLEPEQYVAFCAKETADRFYQAWIILILDRLREEIQIDPDMIERDTDALKGFAMDLTGVYYDPGNAVVAISTAFAQNWPAVKMKGWADDMLKIAEEKATNPVDTDSASPRSRWKNATKATLHSSAKSDAEDTKKTGASKLQKMLKFG
eukprot:GEMP01001254.1.p1 GENE.GEMP01001254.1~~GEMP01001254.1.p1  ORF type:complete len:1454 (+),score=389.43 GEMP01001254.1:126-4487(+)